MGNSSTSSRSQQKSESFDIRQKRERWYDFSTKSRSLTELGTRDEHQISGAKSSEGSKILSKDLRNASTASSLSRSKSLRKDLSHPINVQGREIILQCFENPHSEFANKVLQRIFEKRNDYQKYVYTLGKERSYQMSIRLKDLIEDVVANISNPDNICAISKAYGEEHVELKAYGFKPDFWVTMADAITVEGVILDMANHQVALSVKDLSIQLKADVHHIKPTMCSYRRRCRSCQLSEKFNVSHELNNNSSFKKSPILQPADTVAAWSQLVTMMFSSVRDGYYSALRRYRMSSKRNLQRKATQDSCDSESNIEMVADQSETNVSCQRSTSMYSMTMENETTIKKSMPLTSTKQKRISTVYQLRNDQIIEA
ncbi:hypothetical protein DICVIV_12574 [Dictyocaulus viviparus]|uniref:Globin family profile domain-containing protein n=1 Tax=Dictyocaulus viviparus TaxID=29172 RepID=A0A0D8XCF7_DICVI|nr:hypothetical protein DICVIV_12574 [Dictyocaulus viviparus]